MDGGLVPELTPGAGDPLVVEDADDLQHPFAGLGQVEDALDDKGGVLVGFQGGPLLGSVQHLDPLVAIGGHGSDPEAPGCGLPHTPHDLLAKDISYPIDTKSLGIRGGWCLKPVDYDHEVAWNGYAIGTYSKQPSEHCYLVE